MTGCQAVIDQVWSCNKASLYPCTAEARHPNSQCGMKITFCSQPIDESLVIYCHDHADLAEE